MTIVDTKDTEVVVKAIPPDIAVDILNSITKQSILRYWSPTILIEYEEPLPTIHTDNCVNGWLSLIREELYSNPSVEDIFISIEGSDVDVWVVIPERDIAALTQLANIEWELLKMFVSGEHPAFLIDFHIIYRCGRNVEELAPTRAKRLPRQV